MFRRFTIFNAIIFAVAIFALSVPLAEARLGRGGERKLDPYAHSSASNKNSSPIDETILSSGQQDEEASVTNSSEECTVPCRSGSRSSIAVCHQRGSELIEICTEAEAFSEHKQKGDTCGFCASEL
jgi:hypothetical protein